jgi:thiamine pyrophosphate-dependent acetolactate synthase large subunit-like protein
MVSIVHDIVGLQHASMAIFNAWIDRVPIMVLGATGPMKARRRRPRIDWIHTALVQGNQVRDYVKWDDQPYDLESVPESFIRGYRIATTEPSAPVYICYDADLQEDRIQKTVSYEDVSRFAPPAPTQANPEALRRAAELLVGAQHPLIIADYLGRNPEAIPSLIQLAELLAVPVIDKGNRFNFPTTHPLDVTSAAGDYIRKADFILALDVQDLFGSLTTVSKQTRECEYQTAPNVKIAHIHMNDMLVRSWAADYQVLQPVDVPITADTSVALPELVGICRQLLGNDANKKATVEKRSSEVRKHRETQRAKWADEARAAGSRKEVATSFLAYELGEAIKKDDWVLVNGTSNGWARKLWDFTKPRQYLGTSGGAGVGYGMSAAIGAALAHREDDALCVDIQSDGDLLMTSSSLWTAAHHKIPLLIVMHNNQSYYNSEEHGLEVAKFRKRPVENAGIGTHVDNPPVNFAKVAESFGIHGDGPVRRPEELRPAIERALKVVKEQKLPALVDVVSDFR